MNRERMEEGMRLFLDGVAEGTPGDDRPDPAVARRVAGAWADELLAGYREDAEAVLQPEPASGVEGLVAVASIEFSSLCAHHLLPFRGTAGIVFLPGASIAGLGHIARLVDVLSRRLQIQESLTVRLADVVERCLEPRGALVLLEAEHLCLALRGSRKSGHRLRTREVRGVLAEDARLRTEALSLLQR